MLELLQNYTVAEIVSFIVILALAIKALISFLDWAKDRLFKFFRKEEKGKSLNNTLSKIIESQDEHGWSLLTVAIYTNNIAMMEWLMFRSMCCIALRILRLCA